MVSSPAGKEQARGRPAHIAFFSDDRPRLVDRARESVPYPGWLRISLLIGGVVLSWAVVFSTVSWFF